MVHAEVLVHVWPEIQYDASKKSKHTGKQHIDKLVGIQTTANSVHKIQIHPKDEKKINKTH